MNAKYVNAVPLYRQEQEFERYGLHISRQNMANWTIQCADRYLAVLYDYLHEKMCISSSVFPKNRKEKFPILGIGYSHISAGNIFI